MFFPVFPGSWTWLLRENNLELCGSPPALILRRSKTLRAPSQERAFSSIGSMKREQWQYTQGVKEVLSSFPSSFMKSLRSKQEFVSSAFFCQRSSLFSSFEFSRPPQISLWTSGGAGSLPTQWNIIQSQSNFKKTSSYSNKFDTSLLKCLLHT